MAAFKSIVNLAPIRATYQQTAAAGTAPDGYIFTNPSGSGEYFEIVDANAVYDVVGSTSAAADVKVVPNGTALASGTTALAAAFDLTATARTTYRATLSATKANRLVPPGSSVAVDTSGTLTGLTGLVVAVTLKPIISKKQK